MKRYFNYTDANNTECYLELDEACYCLRAIYKTNNRLFNTYLDVEHELYILPEGSLKDSLQFMTPSSKTEFDALWSESMLPYESAWNKLKMKYKVGDIVNARILCFYPQGIISNFGEDFNALSDYKACEAKFGKEKMYPHHEIELYISGFDDFNKIIRLGTSL